jgi:hypothetical protein
MEDNTPTQLIDALPYIDTELNNPIIERTVKILIEQELKKKQFDAEEYVSHITVPTWNFKHSILGLQNEFQDHEKSGKYVPLKERMQSEPTVYSTQDKLAIEAQYLASAVVNLQLLNKYHRPAWIKYNTQLEQTQQALDSDLKKLKDESDQINRKRKLEQVQVASKLTLTEKEWQNLTIHNNDLERECDLLERQVKKLKQEHKL